MKLPRHAMLLIGTMAAMHVSWAGAPATRIEPQVMISTGLAARYPFEAWLVFDKSSDPSVAGYTLPAGASIRVRFPKAFTPAPGGVLGTVMLSGWAQGAIAGEYSAKLDPADPREVVIRIDRAIMAGGTTAPGLKAIHLRTNEINPARAGTYPIELKFSNAGALSGTTMAIAHITPGPVPNVAAYNQLHRGKNEDWQHVRPGEQATLPIDFLVTMPDENRSSISLASRDSHTLEILKDGHLVGAITSRGAAVALTPVPFGPGFARLGIVELLVRAGASPGPAEIVAALNGGTRYTIHLSIDAP